MEEKRVILIAAGSLIAFLIVMGGVLVYVARNAGLSPGTGVGTVSALESCKTLSYGSENGVNIVFFSDQKTAEKYRDYLTEFPPFDERKDVLNFFYIDDYKPTCKRYQDIAVFCHTPELVKKAASCPNDYIVVIAEDDNRIRSSAYLNVMSINSKHQLSVFAHEFGHAFAAFDEEYVPASVSSKSKNCARNCTMFSGNANGCFAGCSKNDYHRSIDSGIMRTLSAKTFGAHNDGIIIRELDKYSAPSRLTGRDIAEVQDCSQQMYYLLTGRINAGTVEIINKSVQRGCSGNNGNGDYEYQMRLTNGSVIATTSFNPTRVFTDVQSETEDILEGEVFEYDGLFAIKIPIVPEARTFTVLNDEGTLEETVSLYDIDARLCKI